MPAPFATELLARSGYDWMCVDMQHGQVGSVESLMPLLQVINAHDVPAFVRIPWKTNFTVAMHAVDYGAQGVIVPMVDTVDEAKAAIAAARYPPVGNRSLGGSLHAVNFGTTAGEYYKRANDEILVVLQTESPRGVDNAEAIYSLKGIDAIFVGPVDLTAQMRDANGKDPSPEAFEAMLQRVLVAGKKCGTPVGLHVQTVEAVQKRVAEGWQFLAIGSKLRMMVAEAQRLVTALDLKGGSGDLARY